MAIRNGRYEVIELLGTGATSRVEKARDTLIGRTVALKTFLNGFGSHQLREQFLREAQIIGQLAHSSIVSLYDLGTNPDGYPYLVMEYVEGQTLEAALAVAPLPLEKAAAWGGDLATALDQAHQTGIIHGDVKPANVLITKEGRPKLGDFGVARFASQAPTSEDVKGTPAFLAPEQIANQTQNAGSDLFSLGIILYLMATGVHPFDADSVGAVCLKILSSAAAPPSHHNPSLPVEFDQIVMRCLAKDPAERFATAQELAAVLYPLARAKKAVELAPAGAVCPQSRAARVPTPPAARTTGRTAALPTKHRGKRQIWDAVASWWNQPLRGWGVWATGAWAAVFVLLFVPAIRMLRHPLQATAAVKSAPASAVVSGPPTTIPAASSARLESAPALTSPGFGASAAVDRKEPVNQESTSAAGRKDEPLAAPVGQKSAHQRKPAATAKASTPVAANVAPVANSGAIASADAPSAKTAVPPAPRETLLNIAVISEVSDERLEVYSDDELLLTVPLESDHRGDKLRFTCPASAGDHRLRVVVYHNGKEVAAENENNSELQAGGGNTLEVHVNRRSRMIVKHQTALEIMWPNRLVSSAL